jgi:ATP-dependent DNA ligase
MECEIFQPLYKIRNKNKYYVWSIQIINESHNYYLLTQHGELNGKQVIHKREVTAKSNRTIIQQCNLEASKKWNDKKIKEGYSENMNENNVQNDDVLIRPMLAQSFDISKYKSNRKCKKISFPCFGQAKYDGIRCLMYKKNNEIIMETRKGTQISNFDVLRKEFNEKLGIYENYVFDGELYSYDFPFEKINGLVRLKKPSHQQNNEINQLKYVIYDVIIKNDLNKPFIERNKVLKNLKNSNHYMNIEFCDSVIIKTLDAIDVNHDNYVNEGFEGLILRNKNGVYEINKRSYDLQKYKKTMDEEFEIINYFEGQGNEKGLIMFTCITKDGNPFNVRPRGSHEYRRKLFLNGDSCVGKKLTVIFQEYSSDHIPRFPVGKSIRYDI